MRNMYMNILVSPIVHLFSVHQDTNFILIITISNDPVLAARLHATSPLRRIVNSYIKTILYTSRNLIIIRNNKNSFIYKK